MSVYIAGLSIPFLEIEGASQRQEWYANSLRETYIMQNYDRFAQIDEDMQVECDKRIQCFNEYEYTPESMGDDYTDAEKAVLFSSDAGGVIKALKLALGR